jgi:hypothetical protein
MRQECVYSDRRFTFAKGVFDRMFEQTAAISNELWDYSPGYRPFHDNENAGVSLFLAGAARAGYAPVAEYPTPKKSWEAIRRRREGLRVRKVDLKANVPGRADLWFKDGQTAFSLEVKKTGERENTLYGQRRLRNSLTNNMNLAEEEAARLDEGEYHHAYACLIAPVFRPDFIFDFANFKDCHLTYRIGSREKYEVFFYFRKLSREFWDR